MEQPQVNAHVQLPFQKSHAFIVGINDYQHVSRLSSAINDASVLARRLEGQHGYEVHAPLLDANRAELLQFFQETIPQKVGPDDRVLFYFAGHGIALDSEEGPNGYLVPADARPGEKESLLPMNTLHQALEGLPCRHGLLILDCCFAGAFKWSSGFRDVLFDLPNVVYEERFWRYVKDPAWQVITSAAYDQKAIDILSNQSLGMRSEESAEHSPFARALFLALEGEADIVPPGKGNGVITASELYAYLRDLVEDESTENAKRQTPSLFSLSRHDKGEYVFLSPRHRLNLPPAPNRNPYMGLSSYNEADSNLFFGRGRVVKDLLALSRSLSLLVVRGASGTGKSSVIKAGVLPQLREQGWHVLPVVRPGKHPVESLEGIPGQLNTGQKQVLVIDQYEELITQCLSTEERLEFEQQLAQWLKAYPQLKIVISIRSDFEPQFKDSPLSSWWEVGRYTVPAFSLEEYREVVVKPASQEVLFFEPEELVDKLVEEVSQAPGALPLLSFTLSELYHAYLKSGREDRALLQEDYWKLGGVIGALRTRADAAYEAHDQEHQDSMRQMMLRMVSLEGGELAGQRIFSDSLVFREGEETQRMKAVAEGLVSARLITQSKDAAGRTYLEPAHDALVKAWSRLWEWIKALGQDRLILRNKLVQAVDDYRQEKDPKKAKRLLWDNNPRLGLVEAELKSNSHGFNAHEEQFIRSSILLRKRKRQRSWIIALTVMVSLATLAVFAFNQMGQAQASALKTLEQKEIADQKAEEARVAQGEAERKQLEAEIQAMAATARSLPVDKYPQAMRLAQLAYSKMTPEVAPAIASRVLGELFYRQFEGPGFSSLFEKEEWFFQGRGADMSFDELTPAAGGQHFLGAYYDANTSASRCVLLQKDGQPAAELPAGLECYSAGFSPDGQYLAAVSETSNLRLFDRQGRGIANMTGHSAKITTFAFSPDSKYLLTCSEDSSCKLWDMAGKLVADYRDPGGQPLTAAFLGIKNYNVLLTAPESTRLVNLQGGLVNSYNKHAEVFSPTGDHFITNDGDAYHVFDAKGALQGSFKRTNPDQSFISHIPQFTPDGKKILTISTPIYHGGSSVEVRSMKGQILRTLSDFGYHDFIHISPYGRLFLGFNEEDGLGFLVNLNGDRLLEFGDPQGGQVFRKAFFTPDKDLLLAYDDKGRMRSWDFSPQEVVDIPHTYEASAAIFIEDGKYLFTRSTDPSRNTILEYGSSAQFISLFSRDGTRISKAPTSNELNSVIKKCTLLPDGRQALLEYEAYEAKDYRLWYPFQNMEEPIEETKAQQLLASWNRQSSVITIEEQKSGTSPDGKLTLQVSGKKVVLRDGSGQVVGEFARHTRAVNSAVFSHDGQYVLSASSDGTAKIWPTPNRIYQWLGTEAKIPELTDEELRTFGVKQQ